MIDTPMILVDNRFADGVVTATTTEVGYSAMHLIDWREYTYYRSQGGASEMITVDCGVAKAADSVALAIHNLSRVGASVAVECSDDDFVADITVALASEPILDVGIFFRRFAPQTKQFWRLAITGVSGAIYIAIAVIGVAVVIPEPLMSDYTPQMVEPESAMNISEQGHPLGVMMGIVMARSRWLFDRIYNTWFVANLQPLWNSHFSRRLPAFFVPTYQAHPEDVFLYRVVAESGFSVPVVKGGLRRLGLDLLGMYQNAETVAGEFGGGGGGGGGGLQYMSLMYRTTTGQLHRYTDAEIDSFGASITDTTGGGLDTFRPDGSYLGSPDKYNLETWAFDTVPFGYPVNETYSASGRYLISTESGGPSTQVYDFTTSQMRSEVNYGDLNRISSGGSPEVICLSNNYKNGADRGVKLFSANLTELPTPSGYTVEYRNHIISPDGDIVCGYPHPSWTISIAFYSIALGDRASPWILNISTVRAITFSNDGAYLAIDCNETSTGQRLRIYRVVDSVLMFQGPLLNLNSTLKYSPNGRWLVHIHGGQIYIYDTLDYGNITSVGITASSADVFFDSTTTYMALTDGTLYDVATWQVIPRPTVYADVAPIINVPESTGWRTEMIGFRSGTLDAYLRSYVLWVD